MALKYTTTKQLGDILRIVKTVPSRDVGGTPTKENVGTGDNSATVFYLDRSNVVLSSFIIYQGATESAATALTETTDYTLDLTKGKITLTGTGVTAVGTNDIFAEYDYFDLEFSDSYLTTVLERAESLVDGEINSTFTDGTLTNPTYPVKVDVLPSRGPFQQAYFSTIRPLKDVSSTIAANITSSATSIVLATGDGTKFPTTGSIIIGNEAMTYTGISTDTLTGVTRGTLGSTAAAHTSGDEVHTTIVQISNTIDGSVPTFDTLSWGDNVYINDEGKAYVNEKLYIDGLYNTYNIPADIENRFKLTYLYGYDTIPTDITRLTLMFAKRELIQDNVGKAQIAGRNEFNPEMFNADQAEIERIIGNYKKLDMMVT